MPPPGESPHLTETRAASTGPIFARGRSWTRAASDKRGIVLAACCGSASTFARMSRAAAKAAGDRLRRLGILQARVDWPARARLCERCPMRVIRRGTSYCGRPFLEDVGRDEAVDGCGCPTRAKAKDPSEHCPIDPSHRPARIIDGRCTCKWCRL